MKYRIVDTDNFGGDYPNEKFIGEALEPWEFDTREEAQQRADELNGRYQGDMHSRFYKVVKMPYELQPGFEP